jgi:hypothetical protein
LKNDDGFNRIKTVDYSFIDSRLKEIEKHAYSIFSYYYKMEVIEQEECKRKSFHLFQKQVHLVLEQLTVAHCAGLNKAYLLMAAPLDILHQLIEERVQSMYDRLHVIQELHQKINEM